MPTLAPNIFRQRLLIEGFYTRDVNEAVIREYFDELTSALDLKMYGEPIVYSPAGEGRKENQGYDAFVPLVDSGISLYIWTNAKFLSVVMYTCKGFDEGRAVEETKRFFAVNSVEFRSF